MDGLNNMDGGDCKGAKQNFSNVNCPDKWLNDGKCDDECSNPANEWDGGDCEDQMPPGFCPHAWLSDGECDAVCDTEQHGFDQAPDIKANNITRET